MVIAMAKLKPRALGTSAVVASFQALMCEPGNEVSVVEPSNYVFSHSKNHIGNVLIVLI